MNNDLLLTIYSRQATVFTLDEISQIFPDISYKKLKDRVWYFTKAGKIKRLKTGIYAKNEFNPMELANKLYKPSYISLETVLFKGGVVFQYYERIFAVSYVTREVEIGDITVQYRRIRKDMLTNVTGVEEKDGYFIATLERAFLDAVFIYKDYFFDNLGSLNWERVFELVPIYNSRVLAKRVKSYYKGYKEDYGKH